MEPDITLTPSLSASPPSHANVILQNITPRADEERQFPLPLTPQRTTCIYVVLLQRGKFHSLPNVFSFFSFPLGAKSLPSLGDARALAGMLRLPLPATEVITTLQKAPGCHFRFHGNKY